MAVVTPSNQYPLGMIMPIDRRLELLAWAQENNIWIVEDDYGGEYNYKKQPPPSLMSLDKHQLVMHTGSFSRSMFPALRINYLVIPKKISQQIINQIAITGTNASMGLQSALAEFIDTGQFTAHLRKWRRIYSKKQEHIIPIAQKHLTKWLEIMQSDVGMDITTLYKTNLNTKKYSDISVAKLLQEQGIKISPLSPYYKGRKKQNGFIINFSEETEEANKEKVIKIAEVMKHIYG